MILWAIVVVACSLIRIGTASGGRRRRATRRKADTTTAESWVTGLRVRWHAAFPRRTDASSWPETIRQLASLLTAGASAQLVWPELKRSRDASCPTGRTRGTSPIERDISRVVDRAAQTVEMGLDPVVALRTTSLHHPVSTSIVGTLMASWTVSQTTGAPLSEVLSRTAEAIEDDIDAQAARDSALAGPRATARILSTLPVVGLGLGTLIGSDPVGVLAGQFWGRIALVTGTVLGLVGMIWSKRLVLRAQGTTRGGRGQDRGFVRLPRGAAVQGNGHERWRPWN